MTTRIETEDVVEAVRDAIRAEMGRQSDGDWPCFDFDRLALAALSATPIERLREENARVVRKAIRQLENKRWEARDRIADALDTLKNGLKARAALTPSADDDK